MAVPTTPEAFAVWREATQEVDKRFLEILHAQHEILRRLGVPPDLVNNENALWDILRGKRPFRWRPGKRLRNNHKARLWNALKAMVLLRQARGHLAKTTDVNAFFAALAALEAGLHAADSEYAVRSAHITESVRKRGGKTTGDQKAAAAKARDEDKNLSKHVKSWDISDELRCEHRSPAAYVARKTGLNPKTASRRVKKISQPKTGQ